MLNMLILLEDFQNLRLPVFCQKGEPEADRVRSPFPSGASGKEVSDGNHAWCLLQGGAHL